MIPCPQNPSQAQLLEMVLKAAGLPGTIVKRKDASFQKI